MYRANITKWLGYVLLTIIICLTATLPTHAGNFSKVGFNILYFIGTEIDGVVNLEWATAAEFNTLNFDIKRADTKVGPYEQHIGPIPASGSVFGAVYEVTDEEVVEYQTYWYILVENKKDGTTDETLPISVMVGDPPIIYLPVIRSS
jgi:hypothetical protein